MGLRPVMSFDVFDTVLTRTVGDPKAVFEIVARDLRDDGRLPVEPATLSRLRYDVEDRLSAVRPAPPTIAEIHRELARWLGLPPHISEATLAAELDWERRNTRAVPGMVERVRAARQAADLVFVSDTPLPAVFLTELLASAGLYLPGDRVFSSADEGATKAHGGALFEVVARELGRSPADFRHTGDNAFSDVAEARLRGWTATHLSSGSLNRYEETLERYAAASDGISSGLAGASRLGRLRARVDGVAPAMASVAAGVATPLLVGYCLWLLQQARDQGLRRLYFLARDGEVMLEVLRPLAAAVGAEDIECRYLYGSRAAWEVASMHSATPEEIRERARNLDTPSARSMLHRLGLTVAEVRAVGADPALAPGHEELPLSAAAVERLSALVTNGPLLDVLRGRARERRALALDYLRQEGLGEHGTPTGVVDVGWVGSTFQALDQVMEQGGLEPPAAFFYIGRSRGARYWSTPSLARRQHAFLFDQMLETSLSRQPSGIEVVVETFCSGREGSVLGYRREGERVVPELVRPQNDAALSWGLDDFRLTMGHTVAALVDGGTPLSRRRGDLRQAVDGVVREFWERPTREEVELWGRFPMEGGDEHLVATPLASPIRSRDVVTQLRAGRLKLRPPMSWRAGTAVLSDVPWRGLLQAVRWRAAHGARLKRAPRRARLEVALRRRQPAERRRN